MPCCRLPPTRLSAAVVAQSSVSQSHGLQPHRQRASSTCSATAAAGGRTVSDGPGATTRQSWCGIEPTRQSWCGLILSLLAFASLSLLAFASLSTALGSNQTVVVW